MRVKKASLNVAVNALAVIVSFLPAFLVRNAFVDTLGDDMLGLVSLYSNLLGLLSLAELGIGSAIVYALYKPFADGDRVRIKGYLAYYAKFYRGIGAVIFGVGLVLLPFLPMFVKNDVALPAAQLYFVLYLTDTLVTYLFSYKLCMLVVSQEGYKVTIGLALTKLSASLLQLGMLHTYPSFLTYVCIQIALNLAFYLAMTAYIRRSYPWLASTEGKLENAEKRSLFKNVKALFLHKIGGTIVFGVDNLIISAFLSLSVVGVFNSYYMVIGAAQTLISSALSGVAAGVGNLLTENRPDRAYEVHRRLFFLSFWIVSCAAIVLWQTLGTFVRLWLGEGHTLDALTIGIVLANFYFMLMRGSVERFKEGAGIYHQDRYAPFVEAAINLGASLALVQTIGLPGVFLGTLISNLTVLFWLKPKLVYNIVFGKRLLDYLLQYGKYLLIAAVPLALTSLLAVPFEGKLGWGLFAAEAALCLFVVNGAYAIVFRNNDEFRYFLALGTSFARARLGKRRQRRAYEG